MHGLARARAAVASKGVAHSGNVKSPRVRVAHFCPPPTGSGLSGYNTALLSTEEPEHVTRSRSDHIRAIQQSTRLARRHDFSGEGFRPVAERLGDRQQFPFLHDSNTGERLYEATDIIDYPVCDLCRW